MAIKQFTTDTTADPIVMNELVNEVNNNSSAIGQIANFRGCVVRKNTNQSILSSIDTLTAVAFSESVIGDYWNVSNPSRLTIPAGVSKVRVSASITFDQNSSGFRNIELYKNGISFFGRGSFTVPATSASMTLQIQSAVIDVVGGDYFEILAKQSSGGALNIFGATTTWACVEVVE